MEAYQDFKELLEWFNAKGVEYLVVGGYNDPGFSIAITNNIGMRPA